MKKKTLIKHLKAIAKEILASNGSLYFICKDYNIENRADVLDIVEELVDFGKDHVKGFSTSWERNLSTGACFWYSGSSHFEVVHYNNAKLKHIKKFIKHLEK